MTPEQTRRLAAYPPEYKEKAETAIRNGRAFCPACYWAGHCNCAHFDECDAWVGPDDTTEKPNE